MKFYVFPVITKNPSAAFGHNHETSFGQTSAQMTGHS